eukprot:3713760-Alexandrium_andersonii.AAC.1
MGETGWTPGEHVTAAVRQRTNTRRTRGIVHARWHDGLDFATYAVQAAARSTASALERVA